MAKLAQRLYEQRRAQGYITIPEAAGILQCNKGTIRVKRQKFPELFVEVQTGMKDVVYMIKEEDLSKLQIVPIYSGSSYERLAANINQVNPNKVYTTVELAAVLGVDRSLIRNAAHAGMRYGTLGSWAIKFVARRLETASVPEMERLTGVNVKFIREYIAMGLIAPVDYVRRGGLKAPLISRQDADKIKSLYHEEHTASGRRIPKEGGVRKVSKPRRWSSRAKVDSEVLKILKIDGMLSASFMTQVHHDVYSAVRRVVGVPWTGYVRDLSDRYAAKGDTKTAEMILTALNKRPARPKVPFAVSNSLRVMQVILHLIEEGRSLDVADIKASADYPVLLRFVEKGWDRAVLKARQYAYKAKCMFPQLSPSKAIGLVDIIEQEGADSAIGVLAISAVQKKGELGADIFNFWRETAGFLEEPEEGLAALIEDSDASGRTVEQLVQYKAIQRQNMLALGKDWKPASLADFKAYMGMLEVVPSEDDTYYHPARSAWKSTG